LAVSIANLGLIVNFFGLNFEGFYRAPNIDIFRGCFPEEIRIQCHWI
jgi:hypothetical protein